MTLNYDILKIIAFITVDKDGKTISVKFWEKNYFYGN